MGRRMRILPTLQEPLKYLGYINLSWNLIIENKNDNQTTNYKYILLLYFDIDIMLNN